MSSIPSFDDALREAIIQRPDVILDDRDVMQALIGANERAMSHNVVDLRGLAMERLESRLDRLQDTHRSVIAAAYENLSGINQINRAVLRLLEPADFTEFLTVLGADVAESLRIDAIRLILESGSAEPEPVLVHLDDILAVTPPGYVDSYLGQGRNIAPRPVTLRAVQVGLRKIYGTRADWIRSEACLRLDLGPGRLPAMLALGSGDPHMFAPQHGTDLLTFFGGVFERLMRRWLG